MTKRLSGDPGELTHGTSNFKKSLSLQWFWQIFRWVEQNIVVTGDE